jgi:toxin FitB
MYLLDTNIVSELRKVKAGKADKNVKKWAAKVDASELFISVITIQEIEIGILLLERKDVAQARVFRRWFEEQVLPAFSMRILAVDVNVARTSASLFIPNPRPVRDALIAATALVHGMQVVTRNTDDFCIPNLPVLNPWKSH